MPPPSSRQPAAATAVTPPTTAPTPIFDPNQLIRCTVDFTSLSSTLTQLDLASQQNANRFMTLSSNFESSQNHTKRMENDLMQLMKDFNTLSTLFHDYRDTQSKKESIPSSDEWFSHKKEVAAMKLSYDDELIKLRTELSEQQLESEGLKKQIKELQQNGGGGGGGSGRKTDSRGRLGLGLGFSGGDDRNNSSSSFGLGDSARLLSNAGSSHSSLTRLPLHSKKHIRSDSRTAFQELGKMRPMIPQDTEVDIDGAVAVGIEQHGGSSTQQEVDIDVDPDADLSSGAGGEPNATSKRSSLTHTTTKPSSHATTVTSSDSTTMEGEDAPPTLSQLTSVCIELQSELEYLHKTQQVQADTMEELKKNLLEMAAAQANSDGVSVEQTGAAGGSNGATNAESNNTTSNTTTSSTLSHSPSHATLQSLSSRLILQEHSLHEMTERLDRHSLQFSSLTIPLNTIDENDLILKEVDKYLKETRMKQSESERKLKELEQKTQECRDRLMIAETTLSIGGGMIGGGGGNNGGTGGTSSNNNPLLPTSSLPSTLSGFSTSASAAVNPITTSLARTLQSELDAHKTSMYHAFSELVAKLDSFQSIQLDSITQRIHILEKTKIDSRVYRVVTENILSLENALRSHINTQNFVVKKLEGCVTVEEYEREKEKWKEMWEKVGTSGGGGGGGGGNVQIGASTDTASVLADLAASTTSSASTMFTQDTLVSLTSQLKSVHSKLLYLETEYHTANKVAANTHTTLFHLLQMMEQLDLVLPAPVVTSSANGTVIVGGGNGAGGQMQSPPLKFGRSAALLLDSRTLSYYDSLSHLFQSSLPSILHRLDISENRHTILVDNINTLERRNKEFDIATRPYVDSQVNLLKEQFGLHEKGLWRKCLQAMGKLEQEWNGKLGKIMNEGGISTGGRSVPARLGSETSISRIPLRCLTCDQPVQTMRGHQNAGDTTAAQQQQAVAASSSHPHQHQHHGSVPPFPPSDSHRSITSPSGVVLEDADSKQLSARGGGGNTNRASKAAAGGGGNTARRNLHAAAGDPSSRLITIAGVHAPSGSSGPMLPSIQQRGGANTHEETKIDTE